MGMALTVPTVLVATGSFSYKPPKNSNGKATFAYEAPDGPGGPDTVTVALDVKPVFG